MQNLAIIYWSGTGNTQAMAQQIAQGAASQGQPADVFAPGEFSPQLAEQYRALALGCPSMGGEELESDEFAPLFQQLKPYLNQKPLALFGSYGWGDGQWMRDWAQECTALGCSLVAPPVIAQGPPDATATEACQALGAALAQS